ncbi:MAG TPA: phosphoglycerate dehydrogenase [Actinomycetota bacterium]|nr:phosphoglycerate dehydrogenase [Actinomycetota bacterium]
MRVLVTERLAERALSTLRAAFEVDVRPDLAAAGLREAIPGYAALIVRSQTTVDADVIEAADELKVIARAGIGLDNVDVATATRRGVMVVNAPQSNVLSAAEHTMALLLALARNVPQAHTALVGGAWERERFQGVELHGKVLGILGLGRVGTMVAQRALAFGMRILAYDPYVSRERAHQLGVEIASELEAVLTEADFLTIHLPRNPETEGLIGGPELALMKPTARLVNTSRGGIVGEGALVEALRGGVIAGAAVDVFEGEPVTEHPLFGIENVVVTPHLGASTAEAQEKAGAAVAEMVALALRGEFVPYAVNVPAAEVSEAVRPFLPLAERLGRLLTALAEGALRSLSAGYLGQVAEHDTAVLTLAALKGVLGGIVDEPVSYVNAPLIARDRGLSLSESRSSVAQDYVNQIVLTAETDQGPLAVGGTLVGTRNAERLVRVYDFDIDMAPAEHMVFFLYEDRPGVIGTVGTILGEAGVNIAAMEVGRREAGGVALMGLTVDSPIPEEALERIVAAVGMKSARSIAL